MAPQPKWREAVDTAERSIGPRIDEFLRSDTFARLLRTSLEVRATALGRFEPYSRAVLHTLNLPTASDLRLLRQQIAQLEREVAASTRASNSAKPSTRPAHGTSSRSRSR